MFDVSYFSSAASRTDFSAAANVARPSRPRCFNAFSNAAQSDLTALAYIFFISVNCDLHSGIFSAQTSCISARNLSPIEPVVISESESSSSSSSKPADANISFTASPDFILSTALFAKSMDALKSFSICFNC